MKRVTGGGAPAEIWRGFMAPILPHIQARAIPGGAVAQPAEDLIGNLIEGDQPPPNPGAPPRVTAPDDGPDPPF
jgi:penicillin-binding protein 1A